MNREYDDVGKPYPRPDDSYVLGLCTGALAAAAVSSSSSLSELLPIAVQTVLISFRLGLCALGMRDRLELSEKDRTEPWSVVISDLEPQNAAAAIKDFCRTNVRYPQCAFRSQLTFCIVSLQTETSLDHCHFTKINHNQRQPENSSQIDKHTLLFQPEEEDYSHLCPRS
jgi:hypothetical protein